jgi:uncharacterized membrane protein YfcA
MAEARFATQDCLPAAFNARVGSDCGCRNLRFSKTGRRLWRRLTGGSHIACPLLVALGLPPIVANATNTVGIWPGTIGSVYGFRQELAKVPKQIFWLLIPAVIGAVVGALLLRFTSPGVFNRIIPLLILFATVLFMVQEPIRRRLRSTEAAHAATRTWFALALIGEFLVAIYGGYFGAGMSIIMLSILGIIGMSDILEMSATTSLFGAVVNGLAGIIFAVSGLVSWPYALAMALGSLAGGYWATGFARKLGKIVIRRLVICVGLLITVVMGIKLLR